MKQKSSSDIRKTWLDFFKKNDHLEVASQSLIPVNDESLLWVNSGVATLKKYFSGKENPPYVNLTNSQKCIRTNDIFNVGITSRHHTLFEMLGNFSIGGYFKEKAIELAFELLTKEFKFPVEKLYITVFHEDDITYKKWIELGISKEHIIKCNRDRNFWDVGSGPCGPCTEIYYDRGKKFDSKDIGEKLFFDDIENDRYVEIWNIVFSEFNNDGNNNYTPLIRKNIDTGAGLERLCAVIQDVPTNFDTDLFLPIINNVENFTSFKYDSEAYFDKDNVEQNKINIIFKVIADHTRAVVFAIADGAIPSNKDRGYILRRLIRRVIVMNHKLRIEQNIFPSLVKQTIDIMKSYYPYLENYYQKIVDVLEKEYSIFKKTLSQGMKLFNDAVNSSKLDKEITFHLVETYGFPIELINELANEHNIKIDIDGFNELFKKHQLISQGDKKVETMAKQNGALIELKDNSEFVYDCFTINAKTIKLYDESFQSVDELKNQNGYIVFDKTCFYATSGGQLHDIGFINNEYFVDDVIKGPNLQHIHHVVNANLKLGESCDLAIDEHRRKLLMKNHSVEHLIHASLTKLIDKNIKQEGAFKSPEKVTFDFQYHNKLTPEQLLNIEKHINDIINESIKTEVLHLTLEEAQNIGAKAYFEDVYKKIKGTLRVIKMGDESCELCGGTHVNNTREIEAFKIINFIPKGAGSWRIEAITSNETINNYIGEKINSYHEEFNQIKDEFNTFNTKSEKLENLLKKGLFSSNNLNEIKEIMTEINLLFRENKQLELKNTIQKQINDIKQQVVGNINQNTYCLIIVENMENKAISLSLNNLINEYKDKVFYIVNNCGDEKTQYFIAVNENFGKTNKLNLNNNIKALNTAFNGKGGGKPFFVQGGCNSIITKQQILDIIKNNNV